jgi:hypothetical protein
MYNTRGPHDFKNSKSNIKNDSRRSSRVHAAHLLNRLVAHRAVGSLVGE